MRHREIYGVDNCQPLRNSGRINKVDAKENESRPTHFYHVSSKVFHPGDTISPLTPSEVGHIVPKNCICMNDKPLPHHTMIDKVLIDDIRADELRRDGMSEHQIQKIAKRKWFCYEVEPQGSVYYNDEWHELRSFNGVKVLRCIGDARAMLLNFKRKCEAKGKIFREALYVSRVLGTQNIRNGGIQVIMRVGHGTEYAEIVEKPRDEAIRRAAVEAQKRKSPTRESRLKALFAK